MTLTFGDGKKTGKYDSVIQLQKLLTTLGFMPGKIDGEYGNSTASAVAAFQNAYGLKATGMLDETTFQYLKKAIVGEISPVDRTLVKVQSPKPMLSPTQPSPMSQTFLGFSMTYWLIGIGAALTLSYFLKSGESDV